MISKVRGIVLHHIKYGESSIIATIYTDCHGRLSFIINGVRGRKPKYRMNLFQPLSILEMEIYYKPSRDLQRVKELNLSCHFRSIPVDLIKSTQAVFLAELLYRTIREEEVNRTLFDFIDQSVQILDLSDVSAQNFSLVFMMQLTKHLGFFPEKNYSGRRQLFDLRNGTFIEKALFPTDTLNKKLSGYVARILEKRIGDDDVPDMNNSLRRSLLQAIADYYHIHLQGMGRLKSLDVLAEVFSGKK